MHDVQKATFICEIGCAWWG